MTNEQSSRAAILSEALPHIRKYSKKTVVVKYGGAAMIDNEELKRAVISDIVLLSMSSVRMVVVHGGGPEISDLLKKIGKEPVFINGLRYTDDETMDVVQMVLAGKIGKDLAALAGEFGGKAVSLSGMDGGMMRARKLSDEYGLVGELQQIDPSLINVMLDEGYIPVISTVALGMEDAGPARFNINADTAASALAVALGAERLILLTDVRGILTDPKDEASLITEISVSDIPQLVKRGVITGGMIPKLECCVEAIRRGVSKAVILDGRLPHAILMEMLTDGGVGTMIKA
ncbi:MAG: acetylglutamate kinase [Clostridiales bacterium]|jgi:acetylglutamate kinase|nr:acetylglutamate kinase [Clostridiales bacterium]